MADKKGAASASAANAAGVAAGASATTTDYRIKGKMIAVIGDEDTVTGFLLAGIGHRDIKGQNFLIVDRKTRVAEIEDAFRAFTNREDVAILLINQHVANQIRHLVNDYKKMIPTLLEIPSKEHPYDPNEDTMMKQVKHLLGVE